MGGSGGHEWADDYLRLHDEERATIDLPTRWGHRGRSSEPGREPPAFDEAFHPPQPHLRGSGRMPDGLACWVAVCWDCAHVTRWPRRHGPDGAPIATEEPDLAHTCDREPDIHGLRALAAFDIRAAARVLGFPQASNPSPPAPDLRERRTPS